MKQIRIIAAATALLTFSSCETLNQAAQQVINQGPGALSTPSSGEIALGLKQALEYGINFLFDLRRKIAGLYVLGFGTYNFIRFNLNRLTAEGVRFSNTNLRLMIAYRSSSN